LCFNLIHFLLFGTFEAIIDNNSVTGDYKRTKEPRLSLTFPNGEIKMFNCSIKVFETSDLKSTYDFSIDIMSPAWDAKKAFVNVKNCPDEEIADILLDQEIFAGVGNMIKNEVLSICRINPIIKVNELSDKELKNLITITKDFSYQFYLWRKEFMLRKHLLIHGKNMCPHCGNKIVKEKTGKRERWSYYCVICQPRVRMS
jgi:endonuclease-8